MTSKFFSTGDKGAHYYRCDFQVHSPKDSNWKGKPRVADKDRIEYAVSLISACREKGLDAVAITDHHDMTFVRYVRQAAAQETDSDGALLSECDRIVVFPGIELTLAVPCQAILLLDPDFEDNRFGAVLTALAINPAPETDEKTAQTERLEDIDSLKILKTKLDVHSWLKDRYIIFPNVSSKGKFSLLRIGMAPKYKEMPFVGGYLDGSKDSLKVGKLNILSGKDKAWGHKRIACIQTSDNRRDDHADLGIHSSWIKWAIPTAEALRQACLAQESRISDTEPSISSVAITSISVQNSSFLGPIELSLNPQYNALIGGRGTGKSTILEYLRWALCDQPPDASNEEEPDYQARRARLIKGTLKPHGATVNVTFTVNSVPHQVLRTSTDGSVQIKIGEDELRSCSESEVRTLLPIQAYSQKQLSNVSVRLDELVRFITSPILTELGQLERQISEQVDKFRWSLLTRQRQKTIKRNISRLWLELRSYQVQSKQILASLRGISNSDRNLLDLRPHYDTAELTIDARRTRLKDGKELISKLAERLDVKFNTVRAESRDVFPERSLLCDLFSEYDEIVGQVDTTLSDLAGRIDIAVGDSKSSLWSIWDAQLEAYRKEYAVALKRSSAQKNRIDQLKLLESKIGSPLREMNRLNGELKSLLKDGETYVLEQERLHELRAKRDKLIQEQCDVLTNDSSGFIRANVRRYANADRFTNVLKEKLTGANIHLGRIDQIARFIIEAGDPHMSWIGTINDLENLSNFDPDEDSSELLPETPFLSNAGATKTDCEKLARKLTPNDWLSLSQTEIESQPQFEYRLREGEYINFSNASSGQQATALLRTLLNQAGSPLLIDQPEEDLDNPVMQEIVELIWAAKKRRQIIFVSHNANLVVNGDAELIAWCEYRKEGDKSGGKIAGEGAIDIPNVREAIKHIIEGGEAAFNLRRKKYGF